MRLSKDEMMNEFTFVGLIKSNDEGPSFGNEPIPSQVHKTYEIGLIQRESYIERLLPFSSSLKRKEALINHDGEIKTFTPVARMDSIGLVLSIVASKRLEVHHMDVKSAFLHGDLEEEIYMKQPKGLIDDPSLVFKLRKSLYGLKKAPREWYSNMDPFLICQKF